MANIVGPDIAEVSRAGDPRPCHELRGLYQRLGLVRLMQPAMARATGTYQISCTRSLNYVKAHLAEIIRDVNASRISLLVTQNGKGMAVIQDYESYRRTHDALMMLKLVAMAEADVAKGRTFSHAEVFGPLKKRVKALIAAEAKTSLRAWQSSAIAAGLDQTTDADIKAEIAAVRKQRRVRSKVLRSVRP